MREQAGRFVQREFRSRLWPMASTGEDCLSEEQSSLLRLPALNAPPGGSWAARVGSRAPTLVPRASAPRP